MASELQRVARDLLATVDEVPKYAALLRHTAQRCRQNTQLVLHLTGRNRQGREIALRMDAAARACDTAAELCLRVQQVGQAWAEEKVGAAADVSAPTSVISGAWAGPHTKRRAWSTIADEEGGEVRSFPSYRAAKRELATVPDTEIHHIVEQSQANPNRSGFSVERINSTDNMTRIPTEAHRKISGHYSRHVPGTTESLRDALSGKSWEYQTEVGRDALDKYMKGRRTDER